MFVWKISVKLDELKGYSFKDHMNPRPMSALRREEAGPEITLQCSSAETKMTLSWYNLVRKSINHSVWRYCVSVHYGFLSNLTRNDPKTYDVVNLVSCFLAESRNFLCPILTLFYWVLLEFC